MSVARAYVPLSNSQMYVLPTRVTANAQDLATAAARTPVPGIQARFFWLFSGVFFAQLMSS